MFVRVYIENGLRRWYDQNNRLKFILRNEFKIFNYEIKRKIISEVRIMDRIALVIGNSDYSNVGKLNNPKNDADDIASILNKLNFDVTKIMDANLIDIQKSVNDFLQALDEYAVGVFFYAGHGMQIDGKNFIVPIDLKLSDKSKTMVSCYCLNSLLEGASSYKGKTLICILDACRDNPFAMGRGFLTGFAPFNNPPKGTMIAYSTSADCRACLKIKNCTKHMFLCPFS